MNSQLENWKRLDNRRTPGHKGTGPDNDESNDDSTTTSLTRNAGFRRGIEGGFWKRSEFLACRAGRHMISDRRGLPPGYGKGVTWQRTAEAMA